MPAPSSRSDHIAAPFSDFFAFPPSDRGLAIMFEKLWNAQTDPTFCRVHFTYRDSTTGDNKDPGTLTGIKAKVRLNGTGALVTTTNDVSKLNQTDHLGAGYVELTSAELTAFDHGELIVSVSGITGVKVEDAQATLYTFNPFDPGATTSQIATQVRTELTAELADIVAMATNDGSLTVAERAAIADAFAARNYRGGSNTSPTNAEVAASGLLDFAIVGTTLTVKHSDGTTAFTRTLTRDQTLQIGAILSAA
jgi:hypothetical protein